MNSIILVLRFSLAISIQSIFCNLTQAKLRLILKESTKTLDDIYTIARIESKSTRDLLALIYSRNLEHSLIPEISSYHLEQELIDDLISRHKALASLNFNQQPLGKYAENLLLQYFQTKENMEVLANNIQLIENKKTIGEIDYLLFDHTINKAIHLEFAIKYYLKTKNSSRETFLGPNAKDNFNIKLDKLLNHQCQLTLSYNYLLPQKFRETKFLCLHLLKGALFYPFEEWKVSNSEFLTQGWWIHQKKCHLLKSDQIEEYFLISSKSDWIFPLTPNQKTLLFENVQEFLNQSRLKEAIMIVRMNKSLNLLDRGFIVPNNWPH